MMHTEELVKGLIYNVRVAMLFSFNLYRSTLAKNSLSLSLYIYTSLIIIISPISSCPPQTKTGLACSNPNPATNIIIVTWRLHLACPILIATHLLLFPQVI